MPFNVKRRGKVTYYYEGDRPVLSALVSEEQPDGDLKIYFSGLTGAHSAKNVLGLDELATMDPLRELPLVFRCWEKWLRDAGIGESLEDVDFLEMHAFACQPKAPNPLVDPAGYAAELPGHLDRAVPDLPTEPGVAVIDRDPAGERVGVDDRA